MAERVELIVGLGNPGPEYEKTRHNAGFWFVDTLAGDGFRRESRFQAELARVQIGDHAVWLLKPMTFMNRSGLSVAALARFYKIPPSSILVVHDELDLPPGAARLKQGGGHGGHNGLRDIVSQLGSRDFLRLRLGIGHPGNSREVVNYVLGRPVAAEREAILAARDTAVSVMPQVLAGELQQAMNTLHGSTSGH